MMHPREQQYVFAEGQTLAQAVQNANEVLARYAKEGWAIESEHFILSQTVHLPAAAPARIVMRLVRDATWARLRHGRNAGRTHVAVAAEEAARGATEAATEHWVDESNR